MSAIIEIDPTKKYIFSISEHYNLESFLKIKEEIGLWLKRPDDPFLVLQGIDITLVKQIQDMPKDG